MFRTKRGDFYLYPPWYKDHRAYQNTKGKGKLDNHTGYIQTNSNSRAVAAHNINKVSTYYSDIKGSTHHHSHQTHHLWSACRVKYRELIHRFLHQW